MMYCLLLQMSCLFFFELYLVFTCGPRQQHPAGGAAGAGAGAGGEAGAGGAGAGAARRPAIAKPVIISFHNVWKSPRLSCWDACS